MCLVEQPKRVAKVVKRRDFSCRVSSRGVPGPLVRRTGELGLFVERAFGPRSEKKLPSPDGSRKRLLEVTMKLVKSLLLGTAAGLATVAGAQAADLPSRKAAP